jgi:hypothetical protein
MRKQRRRPAITRLLRLRRHAPPLRRRLCVALPVVRPSARSAVRSAAMPEREPRSGLLSAASLQRPAAGPPALPAHVIDREENGMKLAIIGVTTFCIAAFTGPLAAQQPAPSDAKVGSTKWNIERVRCSDFLAASDDDRASAAMFYFGYLAAKDNIRTVDTSKIEDNIRHVVQQCSTTPGMTVPEAFRLALRPHEH